MKVLFLLTLLAGGSTVILFNVPTYYENSNPPTEVSAKPPQIFGIITEDGSWRNIIVYGEPLVDIPTYGLTEDDSIYDSHYSIYDTLEESTCSPTRYSYDSAYSDLYLQPYKDLEFYPPEFYPDLSYSGYAYESPGDVGYGGGIYEGYQYDYAARVTQPVYSGQLEFPNYQDFPEYSFME